MARNPIAPVDQPSCATSIITEPGYSNVGGPHCDEEPNPEDKVHVVEKRRQIRACPDRCRRQHVPSHSLLPVEDGTTLEVCAHLAGTRRLPARPVQPTGSIQGELCQVTVRPFCSTTCSLNNTLINWFRAAEDCVRKWPGAALEVLETTAKGRGASVPRNRIMCDDGLSSIPQSMSQA